jgi:hypothetical protein
VEEVWRKNTTLLLVITLVGVLSAPGCASITRRSTQKIPVTSSPAGAAVIVNGVRKGETPLEIRLPRNKKGPVIRIDSPGYNPVEIRIRRKASGGYFVCNFILSLVPGLLPLVIDIHTEAKDVVIWSLKAAVIGAYVTALFDYGGGKIHEFKPEEISVTLTKANGPPRVDTILVDAEELQNIKWIRVRRD